jgi:hypothetical protein
VSFSPARAGNPGRTWTCQQSADKIHYVNLLSVVGSIPYVLTEMGQSLKPVVVALTNWGDTSVRPGPVSFVHDGCGTAAAQLVWCADCQAAVAPPLVRARRRGADELVNNLS